MAGSKTTHSRLTPEVSQQLDMVDIPNNSRGDLTYYINPHRLRQPIKGTNRAFKTKDTTNAATTAEEIKAHTKDTAIRTTIRTTVRTTIRTTARTGVSNRCLGDKTTIPYTTDPDKDMVRM
jgi:hypothetical protein